MKCSIIIPTYNKCKEFLVPCLDSVFKNTDMEKAEVIVVANGCTDETKEVCFKNEKLIKTVWFDSPLGFPKAINEGIKIAKGEYCIMLNNDTVITDGGWLPMLTVPFKQLNKLAITGPLMHYCPQVKSSFILGFCMCMPKKILKEVGFFDEDFGVGSSEDIEMSCRVMNKGYTMYQVPEPGFLGVDPQGRRVTKFPINHIGEGTVHSELVKNWDSIYKNNLELLIKKVNAYE
jgi:GT2 family glycosyltransferase